MLICATLAMAGCVRFHPHPISAADNAARLDARRLDDTNLLQFVEQVTGRSVPNWPPKYWDQQTLTLAAFYFSPDLEVARAQWREAQAGIRTAKARPNPVLTVTRRVAVPGGPARRGVGTTGRLVVDPPGISARCPPHRGGGAHQRAQSLNTIAALGQR